jgi:hypothetical protein
MAPVSFGVDSHTSEFGSSPFPWRESEYGPMSMANPSGAPSASRSHLRLVGTESATREQFEHGHRDPCEPTPGTTELPAHVLVVGSRDHVGSAQILEELRCLLPPSTPFIEAHEIWEVLTRAPGSRMVVLNGDLGDLSAASLVRLLSRRHPTLPVISVGATSRAMPPGDVGAVSR